MSSAVVAPIIGLLGPVSIADENGHMRPVPGARARRLLAVLALAPGATRSSSALIDGVWGEHLPRSPQAALHTQISRLRPLLPDGTIEAGPSGYRLAVAPEMIDVFAAQSWLATGAAEDVKRASDLWRGEPGADLGDDDLARAVGQAAARVRDAIDDRRCHQALADGYPDIARELAQARCDADPFDETAHATLMRALAALGRAADALAVFARLRQTLSRELGTDPGPEIVALHQQLLQVSGHAEPLAPATRPVAVGLRAEPNELLGRAEDVERVRALLATSRIVTVQGPGGAGKTRIANRIGHLYAADGVRVFFVELASVRGEDDVLAAVAATLGVGESEVGPAGRPRMAFSDLRTRLADALSGDTLVVFDNCEHVIEACARIAAELIDVATGVRILATSRSPLRVAAEVIHQLPPLSFGDERSAATDLFIARARAIRSDIRIDLAEVTRLCQALDGLPLAIELAAARVRTMSVAQISERLSQRFALLRSGDRSSPARHRTLHAVIEWSWELLDAPAQVALRRLCRFPGGFSRPAATEVVGVTDVELDDDLEALVDQSLLQVVEDGAVRYRMLETVREFGEEQLKAKGEGAQVDSAIARWARTFAAQVQVPFENGDQAAVLAVLPAEVDNLVWVLRRCMDSDVAARPAGWEQTIVVCFPVLGGFWALRGLHGEVITWGPRVIEALPRIDRETAAALPGIDRERRQAAYLIAAGHLVVSHRLRLLAQARSQLRCLFRADLADRRPMDFASSILLSGNSFGVCRRIVAGTVSDEPRVRMMATMVAANALENSADRRRAMDHAQTALAIARSRGDRWIAGSTLMEIGGLHCQVAEYGPAVDHYRGAIESLEAVGADHESRQVRGYVVVALIGAGRIEQARREFAVFSEGWTPADPDPRLHPELAASIMSCAAELARIDDRPTESAELFERSVQLLLTQHPFPAQDPAVAMMISAGVCGMVVGGRPAHAGRYLVNLSDIAQHMFAPGGFGDVPQVGTIALAFAVAVSAREQASPTAARLFLLARRAGCRLDFPLFAMVMEQRADLVAVSVVQWQLLSAEIDRMSRRQAVREILSITQSITDSA